jgi:hypothetical protein
LSGACGPLSRAGARDGVCPRPTLWPGGGIRGPPTRRRIPPPNRGGGHVRGGT